MPESRPVRFMFTPTGLPFGSQLPCDSISHQAIVVGDPNGQDGVLTSELRRIGNEVEQNTQFHVTLAPTRAKQLNKASVIGYTQMTDQMIFHEACALIKNHGPYSLARRNCKHFSWALSKSIMGETAIKPVYDARYRFTNDILALPLTGIEAGWIFPTTTVVLVNVEETEIADTWTGQVEGSEEHGMFLRSTVERLL